MEEQAPTPRTPSIMIVPSSPPSSSCTHASHWLSTRSFWQWVSALSAPTRGGMRREREREKKEENKKEKAKMNSRTVQGWRRGGGGKKKKKKKKRKKRKKKKKKSRSRNTGQRQDAIHHCRESSSLAGQSLPNREDISPSLSSSFFFFPPLSLFLFLSGCRASCIIPNRASATDSSQFPSRLN